MKNEFIRGQQLIGEQIREFCSGTMLCLQRLQSHRFEIIGEVGNAENSKFPDQISKIIKKVNNQSYQEYKKIFESDFCQILESKRYVFVFVFYRGAEKFLFVFDRADLPKKINYEKFRKIIGFVGAYFIAQKRNEFLEIISDNFTNTPMEEQTDGYFNFTVEVASRVFKCDHIFSLDGPMDATLRNPIYSKSWSGSHVLSFLKLNRANFRLILNVSKSINYHMFYVDSDYGYHPAKFGSNHQPIRFDQKSTVLMYSDDILGTRRNIIFAWDGFRYIDPGERRAIRFAMRTMMINRYFQEQKSREVGTAFQDGKRDENLRLQDVYQGARHFVKDGASEIELSAKNLKNAIASHLNPAPVPTHLSKRVDHIKDVAAGLTSTFNTIKDFDANTLADELQEERPRRIFNIATSYFHSSANDMQLKFETYGKNPLIECYFGYFLQIITNLISNSFDVFQSRKELKPKIYLGIKEYDGNSFLLIYRDTAGGFRDSLSSYQSYDDNILDIEGIKECFKKSFSQKKNGTGYGLWLVKRYLLAHRGRLLTLKNTKDGISFCFLVGYRPLSVQSISTINESLFWSEYKDLEELDFDPFG